MSEGGQSFENDSRDSPIALIQNYMESTEELLPSSSSSSPSVVPPEAAASPDTDDSENSTVRLLQVLEDFTEVFQNMLASFSSTSSDSSESDLQGTNWDDIDSSEWNLERQPRWCEQLSNKQVHHSLHANYFISVGSTEVIFFVAGLNYKHFIYSMARRIKKPQNEPMTLRF